MAGDLVIVGGAETLERGPIMRRFVELAGGETATILLLASATRRMAQETARIRSWLGEAGVAASHIETLAVSKVEAGWERGAYAESEIAKLRTADALWILGGDQNLTIAALRDDQGRDSPLLALLRERAARPHRAGGLVVGGTSAGAAVMSDPMIGAGTSFGTLALPRAIGPGNAEMTEALYLLPGLGLFPEGIVDQHFDARARFARLLEAALSEEAVRPAFGIAEATALVYRGGTRCIEVLGRGGIYVIDARDARRSMVPTRSGPRLCITGVVFHYLSEGDSWDCAAGKADFGAKKELSVEDAAFATEGPEATGPLSPYGRLAEFAARMLLDNKPELLFEDATRGIRYVRGLLVGEGPLPSGGRGPLGWEIRCGRTWPCAAVEACATEAGRRPFARLFYDGRYSFESVIVDIMPIDIEIHRP